MTWTTFITKVGTIESWVFNSGQYDLQSGSRYQKNTWGSEEDIVFDWFVISSSINMFYPVGGVSGSSLISGSSTYIEGYKSYPEPPEV